MKCVRSRMHVPFHRIPLNGACIRALRLLTNGNAEMAHITSEEIRHTKSKRASLFAVDFQLRNPVKLRRADDQRDDDGYDVPFWQDSRGDPNRTSQTLTGCSQGRTRDAKYSDGRGINMEGFDYRCSASWGHCGLGSRRQKEQSLSYNLS